MKNQTALNTFTDGLLLDINPLSMSDSALTNCLNGTLLTNNGNEYMLLNDMGNVRVETAMLPTGYIPLGSTSFGGIIYIVSYNPINKKYQIGSFPSPERNLTKDELGDNKSVVNLNGFCLGEWNLENPKENIITNYYLKVNLLNKPIYPGDKFKVFSNNLSDFKTFLSAYGEPNYNPNKLPRYIKLDIISTLDNGKVITLTDNSTWTTLKDTNLSPFYIYFGDIDNKINSSTKLDEYRNLVTSNYDTYVSKVSGQLGIAAKLEVPTSFSVGYDVLIQSGMTNTDYDFYLYLNWANDNIEDKSRVNPQGITCNVQTITKNEETWIPKEYPITYEGETLDAINEKNYHETVTVPEYYTDDGIVKYLENEDNRYSKNPRKNDGTDFLFVIKGPTIRRSRIYAANSVKPKDTWELKNSATFEKNIISDGILHMKVTPYMPFGQLQFLEKDIIIDLNLLLTGNINLNNYQYYVDNDSISMSFNIEAYPELGAKIESGSINFYPFEDMKSDIWIELTTYDSLAGRNQLSAGEDKDKKPVYTLEDIGTPLSGLKEVSIDYYKLIPNKIYIAEFVLNYSKGTRYFYRLFFNSPIFNNAYGSESDYKDLYLYSKDQNYGITPTLKLDSVTSPSYTADTKDFSKYREQLITENRDVTYGITHKINSTFYIDTDLGQELELSAMLEKTDDPISISLLDSFDRSIKVYDTYKTPEIFNLNPVTNKIELLNSFDVSIPYIIEYSDTRSLPEYSLDYLKEGANELKIILQHVARKEHEGKLQLFINSTGKINDEDNINTEYECTDDISNIQFNTYAILSVLKDIMNNSEYDYITVLFGIAHMWDKDNGYGYKVYDNTGSENYFKLNAGALNWWSKVTCLRINDSVALVHRPETKFVRIDSYFNYKNTDNNDKCWAYRNYGDLMRNFPSDIMTEVIPSTVDRVNNLIAGIYSDNYISEYKKYKDTKNEKILYFLSNITNSDKITNPNINVDYKVTLKLNTPKIKIGARDEIEQPEVNNDKFVNNFRIIDLDKFETVIPMKTVINNATFINEQLMLDNTILGWDGNNVLYDELLNKVYSSPGIVIEGLKLNDQKLVELDSDFSNRCKLVEWYFGWEHTQGGYGLRIDKNNFKNSKQWYKMFYTNTISGLGPVSIPFYVPPGYQFFVNNQPIEEFEFTKDERQLIELRRTKDDTPEGFQSAKITISCDINSNSKANGELYLNREDQTSVDEIIIADEGNTDFNTYFYIKPTSDTCVLTADVEEPLEGKRGYAIKSAVSVFLNIKKDSFMNPSPEKSEQDS